MAKSLKEMISEKEKQYLDSIDIIDVIGEENLLFFIHYQAQGSQILCDCLSANGIDATEENFDITKVPATKKTKSGWIFPFVVNTETVINQRYLAYANYQQGVEYPIKQLQFTDKNDLAEKMIDGCVEYIARKGYSQVEAFHMFIDWLAWSLGIEENLDKKIDDDIQEYLYRNFIVSIMLMHPYDYLGDRHMNYLSKKGNRTAFFPTPPQVSAFMAQLLGIEKDSSVMEPCVGTGAILLQASNKSFNLTGIEIDPFICLMCKINMALYAPWAKIINDNALTYGMNKEE